MVNDKQEATQSPPESAENPGLQSEVPIGEPNPPLELAEAEASSQPETIAVEPMASAAPSHASYASAELEASHAEPGSANTHPHEESLVASAKPQSGFLAFAVTALAGGLLGIGGTFALHSYQAATPQPAGDVRILDLTDRLGSLEKKTDAAESATSKTLAALEARITAVETVAQKALDSANAATADLQNKISASAPAVEALPNSSPHEAVEVPDIGPLSAKLETLEKKLTALEAALTVPKTEERVTEQKLGQPAISPQITRAQTLAIVAQGLLLKLTDGGSFTDELAVIESLGVPADALSSLRGVDIPSERQLVAQFTALTPQILASATDNPASEEENFLDRVTRHAKGLVHVHKPGETRERDVEGLVEEIGKSLADHDLETAYKAWTDLPAPAKSITQSFGKALKARIEALASARLIEAEAVSALGKS
ncbi:MAG: hypothetical protein FWD08_06430 [Alphaproteobacteria bacterium]|nr:hypothetical protein [Alphaproteobacteria bacterium]